MYNFIKNYYKIKPMQIFSSKTDQFKELKDLKSCYLYISKSSSILDDRIEALKKSLKGKINFEADFKIFYGDEGIDEYEFVNFYKIPSFFSEKKVAVIKNFERLSSNIIRTISELISNTDKKSFTTVIVITTTSVKFDQVLLKKIEQIGTVERLNIPVTDSLKRWIDERSELDGIRFTGKAAVKLIENVNFNLNLLKIEYEKLHTFIIYEKDKTVNEKVVDRLVNRVYDMKIFDLVDFIGSRDKENALKALKAISSEKQNVIGIITLIHRMFKAILFLSFDSEEEAKNYIKRYIGHSPYLLGKITGNYKRFSRKYSFEEIIKIFNVINRYDFLLRTSEFSEKYTVTKLISDIVDIKK